GKSTTIKCLTGILMPSSGQIVVDGIVPWRDRQRNAMNIGVVFGQRSQLWWDIPLVDSLELIGRMYRLDRATYRRNLETLSELLCRRIVLIELGRVLYDGTVADLKRRYAPFRELVITLAVEGAAVTLPGAERVRQEGPQAWLRFDPEQVPVADLIVAATERYP